mmetsp:Transcript_10536/g.22391  ORF Transcript_10536/g.22391 Transcript_10536/m.22391 type:complete len:257 (+) Transcript_10536:490-1260(+)
MALTLLSTRLPSPSPAAACKPGSRAKAWTQQRAHAMIYTQRHAYQQRRMRCMATDARAARQHYQRAAPAAPNCLSAQLPGALLVVQVQADLIGNGAALVDGPHDEGLAPAAVASREDARRGRAVGLGVGLCVVARIQVERERRRDGVLRVAEAHGEHDEVGGPLFLAALDFLEAAVGTNGNLDGLHSLDVAGAVANKLLGEDGVGARVGAELVRGLLVAVVGAVDARPRGPRVGLGALGGRLGEELEVGQRLAAVP